MTIVYCIGSLVSPGGAESVLVNKANYFADIYGYEVHILLESQDNKPIYYTISKKVFIHDLKINNFISKTKIPLLGFYKNIQKLKTVYENEIKTINPDIVFVLERGYADFIIPNILPNIPKVRESHSSLEAVTIMDKGRSILNRLKNKFFTFLYKRQLLKYDHVVLLTERDRKKRSYLKNTSVIPNTIAEFNEDKSTLLNKTVISVGRLDKYKNFKDQVLIWENIVNKFPAWELHIYGEGSEKENLSFLIKQLGLSNNVFLKAKTNNIGEVYSNSSIFIFTSLAEGFGIVLVEAMQFGLPVISYDSPCGPSDIIDDAKNGFLIKVGDLVCFEKKLTELMQSKELRKSIGKKAILKSEEYKPKKIMKKWDVLIQSLTKKNYA